jgi:tetratricopeptide (TPR) repeat protein
VRVVVGASCLGLVAVAIWAVSFDAQERSKRLTREAQLLAATGDDDRAIDVLRRAAELWPENAEAVLAAAQVSSSLEQYREAVAWLNRLPACSEEMRLRAAILKARLLNDELHRLSAAESAWRNALKLHPGNIEACKGLATLLATCGRPVEAAPYILQLVRQGVTTDLLVVLSREGAVIRNMELLEQAHSAAPHDPNPMIGLAWHRAEAGETDVAIELLREALQQVPEAHSARAALGTLLYNDSRWSELADWLHEQPRELDRFASVWIVRGQLAERAGLTDSAIRCYLEAGERAPDSKFAAARLSLLLAKAGQRDAAQQFARLSTDTHYLQDLQGRVLFSGGAPSLEAFGQLIDEFERQGRTHEACGWCRLALQAFPTADRVQTRLTALEQRMSALAALEKFDSGMFASTLGDLQYPLPDVKQLVQSIAAERSRNVEPAGAEFRPDVRFRNDAVRATLQFRFLNGTDGPLTQRIYELTGGGAGIIDYDCDGCADVFLTQGCRWPPSSESSGHSDCLFRNQSATHFVDVSTPARLHDTQFGQGVAVGDINNDGFPDVYVANIGPNKLWINQGDGTFAAATWNTQPSEHQWTTSCAVVDLNRDTFPDVFDVNYLSGEDVFERICRGAEAQPRQCSPLEFDGTADRLLLNTGDGSLTDVSPQAISADFNGKGLGLAVWYESGSSLPQILVANDTVPNQLLVSKSPPGGVPRFDDLGFLSGISLNGKGRPEGSMGIAVADLNADGLHEFHVTNFYNESATLFWQVAPGFFEDRTQSTRLHTPSLKVLGFGTQFLDANLDGLPELFVTNGHIDDLQDIGQPYRMPPQLFYWNGSRFETGPHAAAGSYFADAWLGRAAARVDWNNDGLNDLVVGHLEDDYALLTNITSKHGNFLSLRLVGTVSSRDATGTSVRISVGRQTQFQQLAAGDGFQASNERRLIFGLGAASLADTIEIAWPSGIRQTFKNLRTSRHYVLIEDAQIELDAGGRRLAVPE